MIDIFNFLDCEEDVRTVGKVGLNLKKGDKVNYKAVPQFPFILQAAGEGDTLIVVMYEGVLRIFDKKGKRVEDNSLANQIMTSYFSRNDAVYFCTYDEYLCITDALTIEEFRAGTTAVGLRQRIGRARHAVNQGFPAVTSVLTTVVDETALTKAEVALRQEGYVSYNRFVGDLVLGFESNSQTVHILD